MPHPLSTFLETPGVVVDVRSPSEHQQGHIPNSINVPLFSDEERARLGYCYKHKGKQNAVALGYSLVTPRIPQLLNEMERQVGNALAKIHCWRGGMRSSSFAELLRTQGWQATTLDGGYKRFRRWVLNCFYEPQQILILGGLTGSGKTRILQALAAQGEQIIDLEALAKHKGSAFGQLGNIPAQPSNEQWENELASKWTHLTPQRRVWIEDESRMIGHCKIPDHLFSAMQKAPRIIIERPIEERIETLVAEYTNADNKDLKEATLRIRKKLGGQRTTEILTLIDQKNYPQACQLLLSYYDRAYKKHPNTSPIIKINASQCNDTQWATQIIATAKELTHESHHR